MIIKTFINGQSKAATTMGMRGCFPFALVASLLFFAVAAMMVSPSRASQKVLLRDLSVVTLQRGGITQGRRSAGVPQLTCVGGTAKNYDSYWCVASLYRPSLCV